MADREKVGKTKKHFSVFEGLSFDKKYIADTNFNTDNVFRVDNCCTFEEFALFLAFSVLFAG